MSDTRRRTTEEGNTITRELFVDANSQELPTEKILDIEKDDDDEEDEGPPGDE